MTTPTTPSLLSLCCHAPPAGGTRATFERGLYTGYCSACGRHSCFCGDEPAPRVWLPLPQAARERQLRRIERSTLVRDLFTTGLGMVVVAVLLLSLFYLAWAWGESERGTRQREGVSQEALGGAGGRGHGEKRIVRGRIEQ